MSRQHEYGLLIDYEYCTGCQTCRVACAKEHKWQAGLSGMQVNEIVQPLPKDKYYLTYMPFPTELCVLCAGRTKKGLKPACVQHCMANCITYGMVSELAEQMKSKSRMVLWVPK